MTIAANPGVKAYAGLAGGDIPLADLSEIVGEAVTHDLVLYHAWAYSSWGDSQELLGVPLVEATTDAIRLRITNAAGDGVDEADVPLGWFRLPAAEAGDTLTAANGIFLDEPTISGIRVGRTAANRMLVAQAGGATASPPTNVQGAVDVDTVEGGLLTRRLNTVQERVAHTLIVHQRAAAEPAIPAGASYDGSTVGAGTNGWRPVETPLPTGSDPEWIASAQATFDPTTGEWTIGTWTVVQRTDFTGPDFATDPGGPWTVTDPDPTGAGDLYARVRASDGTFAVTQLRHAPTAWTHLASVDYTDTTRISSSSRMGAAMSLDDVAFVVFRWARSSTTVPVPSVVVPSFLIRAANRGAQNQTSRTVNLLFHAVGAEGGSFAIGRGPLLTVVPGQVSVEVDFGAPNSGTIGTATWLWLRTRMGTDHEAGTLEVWTR